MSKTIKNKENKAGQFSTLSNLARRDKNLTANSKILLMEILSDTDKFDVSPALYTKRLGISMNTYIRSIQELIKNGYMRRTKRETELNVLLYDYEVSDSGGLKSDVIEASEPQVTQSTVKEEIVQPESNLEVKIESNEVTMVVEEPTIIEEITETEISEEENEKPTIETLIRDTILRFNGRNKDYITFIINGIKDLKITNMSTVNKTMEELEMEIS